jgi:hypothetical protein
MHSAEMRDAEVAIANADGVMFAATPASHNPAIRSRRHAAVLPAFATSAASAALPR